MPYVGKEPVRGQNRELDDISGTFNGGNTAFTMQVGGINTAAGSANQVFINLGGVMQNPGTDFTVASSTITFTTPPANGLSFWGLIQGDAVDIQEPADGSVTSSKIASGNLTLPGDVTIPDKIVHDGDTNTAIRFPAADTVSVETGGSERVRVDSSGRVGIGTNNPDQKLKIEDSSNFAIHLLKTGSQDTLIQNTGQTEICAATGGASGQRIVFRIGANTGSMPEIARFTPDGLCFGSDTATANALDDYEQGSWTVVPTVETGSVTLSSSVSECVYTKIGRVVQISGRIRFDSVSGQSGWLRLSLPFTNINSGPDQSGAGQIPCNTHDINLNSNAMTTWLELSGNNAFAALICQQDNGSWFPFNTADLKNNDNEYIAFSGTYQTDAT